MLVRKLESWARQTPHALAAAQDDTHLTYSQFVALIAGFQASLPEEAGSGASTAVILTRDLLDSWTMSLAVRSLGWDAVVVQNPELLPALELTNAGIVLVEAALHGTVMKAGRRITGTAKVLAMPSRAAHLGETSSPRMSAAFGSQILYTTGTTGRHKKVLMPGEQEDRRNAARALSFGVTQGTVALTNLPPYCGAGFKTPSSVWHAGGAVVFDDGLDLQRNLELHGVTCVLAGPQQLRSLVAARPLPDALRHSFEIVFTSGPLPLDLASRAADLLSRRIRVYYGATEIICQPLGAWFASVDDLIWLQPETGRNIVVLGEGGEACRDGEEGTLAIGLQDIDAHGYLDDPQATSRFFRDGYFVPGDRAMRRADGRIRILGRESDVINLRGQKLSVLPIEQALQAYLAAEEVCIFAEMNERGEEEVLVAVRIARNIRAEEMREMTARFLPFDLVRFARLSHFPKSEGAFGKTLRSELRRLLIAARPGPG